MSYNNVNTSADKKYISALDSILDTREIDSTVFDIYREKDFTDILFIADRKRPVKQLTAFYSWVNDQLFKPIIVQSASSSGTRTPTTVVTAATSDFVRPGDVAKFTDGKVCIAQTVTTSSDKDSILWKEVSGSTAIVTAGDTIYVFSYAGGERGDAPANKTFGYSKYSNRIQIFAESDSVTDVQNVSTLEAHVNGKDTYVVKSHIDKLKILMGGINAAFIGGDISDAAFSDASPNLVDQNQPTAGGGGGAVQTTRGLDKWTTAYGITQQANAGSANGNVLVGDFNTLCDSLNTNRAPEEQLVLASNKARRGFDNFIKNLPSSGGLTSVRLVIDGKELDATVDKFSYGGYEFNFKTMPILNHPMFSQVAIGKSAYFLPLNGRVPVEGGGEAPCIGTAYAPANEPLGNELIGESQSGTKAPLYPSGHIREFKTSWVSYQGLDVKTPTFFARMQVSA
jgi:hypothetical protein